MLPQNLLSAHLALIEGQIDLLKENLTALQERSGSNPESWAYAGTAEHVHETLRELNRFLSSPKNRS